MNKFQLPVGASGNFAVVYQLKTPLRSFAVRCFITAPPGDQEARYNELASHFSRFSIPALVDFSYLPQGVFVHEEDFPIVRMEWVRGHQLQLYVDSHLSDPTALRTLAAKWRGVVAALHGAHSAHGDLQHGNVLIDDLEQIRLVDYDGFFIPRLSDNPPGEVGHPNYQHPERLAFGQYDDKIDNFASLVIYLSLLALQSDPRLWNFHNGENLIFVAEDFKQPGRSAVWKSLGSSTSTEVRRLTHSLSEACRMAAVSVPSLESVIQGLPEGSSTQVLMQSDSSHATGSALHRPLVQRIEDLRSHLLVALVDGAISEKEKHYIHQLGERLQVPRDEIEKMIRAEMRKQSQTQVKSPRKQPSISGPILRAQRAKSPSVARLPINTPRTAPTISTHSSPPFPAKRIPAPLPQATALTPVPGGQPTPRSGTFLGWCVGILFYLFVGALLTPLEALLPNTPGGKVFLSCEIAWLLCSAICFGMMTTGAIRGDRRKVVGSRRILVVVSILLVLLVIPTLHPFSNAADQVAGTSADLRLTVPQRLQTRDLRTRLLNASYPSNCSTVYPGVGFGNTIPLRKGDWDNGQSDPVKHAYFGVMDRKIIFADLTRDGRREAVVPTACGIYASTETYTEIFVVDTSSPALRVLARLSPADWGDSSRGITWNTSDVEVEKRYGYLLVSFQLGGTHAQPDWYATSGFTWNGSQFSKFGFDARGETGGAHPGEVIAEGGSLYPSNPQLAGQNNTPSSLATGSSGEPSSPGSGGTGAQSTGSSSAQEAATAAGNDGGQASAATQTSTGSPRNVIAIQWLRVAESQFEQDDFKDALQRCNLVLQIDPQNAGAIQLRGKIENTLKILGISGTAQASSGPQAATVQQWLALAESQFANDQFASALQSCNAALQIDPQNAQAMRLKRQIVATTKILGGTQ